jgi:hypothetical protein
MFFRNKSGEYPLSPDTFLEIYNTSFNLIPKAFATPAP